MTLLALWLALAAAGDAPPDDGRLTSLEVGDVAPPLEPTSWLRGEPPSDPDRALLVMFTATWCGPCKAAQPTLARLAKEHEGVLDVAAIYQWEADEAAVIHAMPHVPAGYTIGWSGPRGEEGRPEASWFRALGASGVPLAVIVSGGHITWVGHPAVAEPPLQAILQGTWDLDAARATHREDVLDDRAVSAVLTALYADDRPLRAEEQIAAIDGAVAARPRIAAALYVQRAEALAASDRAALLPWLSTLQLPDDYAPDLRNSLAWALIAPPRRPTVAEAAFARTLAARAVADDPEPDAAHLDTLALATFWAGDRLEAARIGAQAFAACTWPEMRPDLMGRLKRYLRSVSRDDLEDDAR